MRDERWEWKGIEFRFAREIETFFLARNHWAVRNRPSPDIPHLPALEPRDSFRTQIALAPLQGDRLIQRAIIENPPGESKCDRGCFPIGTPLQTNSQGAHEDKAA